MRRQLLHKRFARATVAGPLWVKDPPRYLCNARYYSPSTELVENVTSAALEEERTMRLAKSGSISVSAAKSQNK